MNRLERLYAIGEAVRRERGRPITTARLAEEFEVSRRTIDRDLAALRAAGVPLYAEQGRAGGVVSLDTGSGVVVTLSTAEVTALLIAVASGGSDMPFAADAMTATNRLIDGLPDVTREGVEELRQKFRYASTPGSVSSRVRQTVEESVRRGVVVNLTYVDSDGNRTERGVEPTGFYRAQDGWSLIGWCQLRRDARTFRLDRIESARLTRRVITPRDLDEVLGWVPDETATP